MPTQSLPIANRRFQCRHIFTDGHRCGSPCLRGEDFCYYHHATRRPKTARPHDPYNEPPNQTAFTLPRLEDHSSVQHALGTVIDRLATNALDPRRAGLILYALQIASGNLASAPKLNTHDMVLDVTHDDTDGPLAPTSEMPGDALVRAICNNVLDPDDDEEEDGEDEEDYEDED